MVYSRFTQYVIYVYMYIYIYIYFLFFVNAKIGRSAKIFNFGSVCRICQVLPIIVLRSGRMLLYVTVGGKCSVLDVFIFLVTHFLELK